MALKVINFAVSPESRSMFCVVPSAVGSLFWSCSKSLRASSVDLAINSLYLSCRYFMFALLIILGQSFNHQLDTCIAMVSESPFMTMSKHLSGCEGGSRLIQALKPPHFRTAAHISIANFLLDSTLSAVPTTITASGFDLRSEALTMAIAVVSA